MAPHVTAEVLLRADAIEAVKVVVGGSTAKRGPNGAQFETASTSPLGKHTWPGADRTSGVVIQ